MTEMTTYSSTAWAIASKYSHVLASETRDLAAWIDNAIAAEREACAKVAEEHAVNGAIAMESFKVLGHTADYERHGHYRTAAISIANTIRARGTP